jgi:hypothetical protein
MPANKENRQLMKSVILVKFAVTIFLVGILLIGVVAVGQVLLAGIFSSLDWQAKSSRWRLPLRVTDIVVDKNGSIYTVNNGDRIQVYNTDGEFLMGWSCGKGWLTLGSDDKSIVVVRPYDPSVQFSRRGFFLTKWADRGHYQKIAEERGQKGDWIPVFQDPEGNTYRQEGWILHSIVRIDPNGEKTTVVTDPIYLVLGDYVLGILLIVFSLLALKLIPRVFRPATAAIKQNPSATNADAG